MERAFDAAVQVGPARRQDLDVEAVGARPGFEAGIDPDVVRPPVAANGGHVVVGQLLWDGADVEQCLLVQPLKRLESLVDNEPHVEVTRETGDHREAVHHGALAAEQDRISRPIHLTFRARGMRKRRRRLPLATGT